MGGKAENIRVLSIKWFMAHRYKKDPKFSDKELAFVEENLTEMERVLYFQMDFVDQRHALEVAKTVNEDPRIQNDNERKVVVKAALLHDIGKIKGDFTVTQRVLVKLINKFMPKIYQRLLLKDNKPKGTLANAVFVYATHPSRGAYMLETFGVSETVVELIRNHHEMPKSRFERLLKDADSLN
ncbi:MAG: HD domain-containing protein [Firmicutes bacterium]|nr:HD domain-containing protein [Bacillota bacterium]MDD4263265.1 HD domain-containing protein [Bacillota bacterium]MDD4693121.1 HD domain-containing protein [Bacillota bacterium]